MQKTKHGIQHMKFLRTNLPLGMTILLVILTILLAFIAVPFLLIVVFCWLIRCTLTGGSPSTAFSDWKDRRRSRIFEGPSEQNQPRHDGDGPSAVGDDTIECEILSSHTFDENGQEIR